MSEIDDGRAKAPHPSSGARAPDGSNQDGPSGPRMPWEEYISESLSFSTGAQQALGRAIVDPTFRERFFDSREQALSEFEIPGPERQLLLGVDRAEFELIVDGLQQELLRVVEFARTEEEARLLELARAWEDEVEQIFLDDDDEPFEGPDDRGDAQ